jgi:hypothetical protein
MSKISSCSESSDENIVKNMYVMYVNKNNEEVLIHQKDLESYNNLYVCKQKFENRNTMFYITENDLVDFNDDSANVLYLKITKEEQENKLSKILPKAYTCPTIQSDHSYHKFKNIIITSSKDLELKHKIVKQLSKNITINDIIYTIIYKDAKTLYSTFKIKQKHDKIYCFGTYDHKINSTELIVQNYTIKTINYNGFDYEIFNPPFDGFVTPIYIQCMQCKMSCTIDIFLDIFQNIN